MGEIVQRTISINSRCDGLLTIVNRNNNSNYTDNHYKGVICFFFRMHNNLFCPLFFHSRALSRALLNFKVTSSFRFVITILHY